MDRSTQDITPRLEVASAVYLTKPVSTQPNAWSSLEEEQTIGFVLEQIRQGTHRTTIERLRQILNADREEYSRLKKSLPGVTFSGTFSSERKQSKIKVYNAVVVLDIDKLSEEDMPRVSDVLQGDRHVLSYWRSPSDSGFKGLIAVEYFESDVPVDWTVAHKQAFARLQEYFTNVHSIELDKSGSDVTRLCFLSYDPELVVKSACTPFLVRLSREVAKSSQVSRRQNVTLGQGVNPNILLFSGGRNSSLDRRTIQSVIKYLRKRHLSITSTYDRWFRVGLAIADAFNYDLGLKYYLELCRLDGERHDEGASKAQLYDCYMRANGSISLRTIVHFAEELGYIERAQRGEVLKATQATGLQVSAP